MKEDLTEIAIILDRSGSMQSIKDDMDGGLWSLITEQHGLPGMCRVSLYRFDDHFEVAFEGRPSGEITATDCRLEPRGQTALFDAVVRSLGRMESRILGMDEGERPKFVIVVIATDGRNNASREANAKTARDAIERVTSKYNWKIQFLAANASAFEEGDVIGRDRNGAVMRGFMPASAVGRAGGMRSAYKGASAGISSYRTGKSDDAKVEDEDDKKGGKP